MDAFIIFSSFWLHDPSGVTKIRIRLTRKFKQGTKTGYLILTMNRCDNRFNYRTTKLLQVLSLLM